MAAVEEFFSNSQLAEREDLKSNLAFFLIFLWGPNQGKAFSSRAVNLPFAPLITMTENERCDRLLHKKRTNPVDKSAALFILALSVPSSLKPGTRTHLKVGFIHATRTRGKDVCGGKKLFKDALQRISLRCRAWFVWSTFLLEVMLKSWINDGHLME